MKRSRWLALLAAAFASAVTLAEEGEAPAARIVTGVPGPSACLAPVQVHTIDGEAASVGARGFDLAPGTHSLHAAALLDATKCPPQAVDGAGPLPPLRADFDAGKTYFIGLDHAAEDVRDWRLVVWKILAGDGTVLMERQGDLEPPIIESRVRAQ